MDIGPRKAEEVLRDCIASLRDSDAAGLADLAVEAENALPPRSRAEQQRCRQKAMLLAALLRETGHNLKLFLPDKQTNAVYGRSSIQLSTLHEREQ